MSTFVFLHAHPDDEAIGTAGTMAAAAQAGHRVIAVFATRGERGDVPETLHGHATLGELREHEAQRAGRILGVTRVAFLGYEDSGEDPAALPPGSFAAADVDEAAGLLAGLLRAEAADALLVYDPTGVTGHPDHVAVHRVGVRAGELAGPGVRVYEGTFSESQVAAIGATVAALAAAMGAPPGAAVPTPTLYCTPDAEVTTSLDVRPWLRLKRAALAAHASQIGAGSFFLAIPDDSFAEVFGREHYVDRAAGAAGPGPLEAALLGAPAQSGAST